MDNYGEIFDSYLMHYGTPGMHWRTQGPGKRYQSQAVYAQGRPNPDAKVRGKNELNDAKERMSTKHNPRYSVPTDNGMAQYPPQKISDFKRLNGKPTYESRFEINHPANESGSAGRHYNCPNCAAAFEMQERGYDVIARASKNGSNVGDVETLFSNGKLRSCCGSIDITKLLNSHKSWQDADDIFRKTPRTDIAGRREKNEQVRKARDDYFGELDNKQMESADKTANAIRSQGKNARGIIVVGWMEDTDLSKRTTSYHAFNYKNENGEVKFYDAQSRSKESLNGYSVDYAKMNFFLDIDPREVYLMRTDTLKPTEKITGSVYSPNRANDLKHAVSIFDELTDSYLMHYGTPGMHWRQQGQGKRYQSHAVYAQGQPNPDAKVRGEKDSNSKLNDLIKSGQMKSVGVSNIKGWESVVKNLYNSAKKEKSDDKLTKGTDNLFKEIDRLRKQAADNAEKTISSQGNSSSGTIAVRNLYDRYSPERTAESYSSYSYRNENGSVKYYKPGSDKEVGKDTVFSDFDPRGVYVSRSNDKQQASAGVEKGKVDVLSKKSFNDLPPKDRVRMQIDAVEGKNYEFNKKIRDLIQNEKDGSSGRIDTYMPTRGPAQLNWEKVNGKVVFREPLFNRKASNMYVDKVLNRSMYGGYTRK